jgi:transcriptional regulator of arginine metabolism
MKISRQEAIKKIIDKQVVETQSDLADALQGAGFDVTQATVSRDIKEMMLVKVPSASGKYRYAFPKEHEKLLTPDRMERTFHDSILSITSSENMVVVRTLPGTAQAVAYAIDYLKWPEVLGTVGGDDTIFICINKKENADKLISRFGLAE